MLKSSAGRKKVTVLISGRGSNLKALLDKQNDFFVGAVVSNNPSAEGLCYAKDAQIPYRVVERKSYPSLSACKDAVLEATLATEPDLVALAGFMMVLHPAFIEAFSGRLINIHPSLLPMLPGLETHKRALADGLPEHGATVHFVDSGVDTGPRIAQARLPLMTTDTVETLSARVLTLEHRLYPWVVSRVASGDIQLLQRAAVTYSARAREEAARHRFDVFVE